MGRFSSSASASRINWLPDPSMIQPKRWLVCAGIVWLLLGAAIFAQKADALAKKYGLDA